MTRRSWTSEYWAVIKNTEPTTPVAHSPDGVWSHDKVSTRCGVLWLLFDGQSRRIPLDVVRIPTKFARKFARPCLKCFPEAR